MGGDLPELIGHQFAQDTIDRVDQMYLDFGADPHVEGLGHADEVAEIRRRAISAGLKLVDCPIRHLGTEKAQELYARIEKHLLDAGVNILFETECEEVVIEDGVCSGLVVRNRDGETRVAERRSSPRVAVVPAGSTPCARSTALGTWQAPLTWAFAWKCATRSWSA